MNLQPDTMAQPVIERGGKSRLRHDGTGRTIDLSERCPRLGGGTARPVRVRDDPVDLTLPARGLPHDEGARHVGVVTGDSGPEVHEQEIAPLDRSVRGFVMGLRRVGSRGNDGGE